ncbi:exopolysaccharide biosynthesis protein [Sphingomonas spermidinifaciens]|uniref:Exopolysaccharide biosynthesis protein n=1 Tax=Sphingomonas spermidinifaciens TaxID=1141889 RepID=A0A2A4B115_9SPHN|nr:GNVR domain-containing protein [Sphingomonas spermidinifaciens]PCD01737.1 exopolysaccharide biosynthesis protein [Sphingomonas spermidinifaciens]
MIRVTDLVHALSRRLRFVLLVGGGVFVAVMILGLLQPRRYTAASSLLIDVTERNPVADQAAPSPQVIDTVIGTQTDILKSDRVFSRVAREAGLVAEQPGDNDTEKLRNAVIAMQKRFGVVTVPGSNVVKIFYNAPDPEQAADIANRIADSFLAEQVALRADPARRNAAWYDDRIAEVRGRLEAAQARLSQFQRERGIVGIDRLDLQGDRVKTLSAELTAAQAAQAQASSVAGMSNAPSVASSAVVQDLQRDVATQAAKVQDLSKTLGPNHPDMIAARASLSELRASLGAARSSQAQSLNSGSVAASRRVATIQAELAQEQQRLLAISGVQDQLAVLQRDVDAARQTYDAVRQRFNEAALEGEISQASATRLDRASVPMLPSQPNLVLWFLLAITLGAVAGILPIIVREVLRPRLRSIAGTAQAIDMPTVLDFTVPLLPGTETRRLGFGGSTQ